MNQGRINDVLSEIAEIVDAATVQPGQFAVLETAVNVLTELKGQFGAEPETAPLDPAAVKNELGALAWRVAELERAATGHAARSELFGLSERLWRLAAGNEVPEQDKNALMAARQALARIEHRRLRFG
jgi:hypothetical protein